MADDLEKRIETALDLLKPQGDGCSCDSDANAICESCFIYRAICGMKRERQVLIRQRDTAVKMLMSTGNGLIHLHQSLDSTLAAFLKAIDDERKESDACTEKRQG